MTATATISLDYFHGTENKMCSFYRIPKAFEKFDPFKAASLEAKYLYSLMLDRVGISIRNGWFDAGRAFIYFGVKEIIETIRVGKNKALQIIHELEKLGLILREKQGQGKPAKIFVKNIIELNENAAPSQNGTKENEQDQTEKQENQKTINKEKTCEASDVCDSMEAVSADVKQELSNGQAAETTENMIENTIEYTENADDKTASPEFGIPCAYSSHADSASISAPSHSRVAVSTPTPTPAPVNAPDPAPAAVSSPDGPTREPQTSHFQTSGSPKMGSQEVYSQDPNYNKRNKTQENKNDFSYIHPSICANEPFRVAVRRLALSEKMDEMEECRDSVRDLISYEDLIRDLPQDRRIIDGYVEILTETLNSDKDTIRIGQQDYSIRDVKDRLYQLTREHILYVRECMKNTTTRIYNMRAYILTALFNAPVTMEQYYDSMVSHDMAEDSWGSRQYGTGWGSRSF